VNNKRETREFCFQYFFHLQLPIFKEIRSQLLENNSSMLINDLEEFAQTSQFSLTQEIKETILKRLTDAIVNYNETQSKIETYLKNWKFDRIAKVDQTILILGFSEITSNKDLYKVIINESIELAKKYGTKESSSFINGVLDNFVKKEVNA
jgi:N utilization substance protein B